MLRFIFCFFSLHGVTEIGDDKKEYQVCLKEFEQ